MDLDHLARWLSTASIFPARKGSSAARVDSLLGYVPYSLEALWNPEGWNPLTKLATTRTKAMSEFRRTLPYTTFSNTVEEVASSGCLDPREVRFVIGYVELLSNRAVVEWHTTGVHDHDAFYSNVEFVIGNWPQLVRRVLDISAPVAGVIAGELERRALATMDLELALRIELAPQIVRNALPERIIDEVEGYLDRVPRLVVRGISRPGLLYPFEGLEPMRESSGAPPRGSSRNTPPSDAKPAQHRLHGNPQTPEEWEAFIADLSPGARFCGMSDMDPPELDVLQDPAPGSWPPTSTAASAPFPLTDLKRPRGT
jgi:hypothetical protein